MAPKPTPMKESGTPNAGQDQPITAVDRYLQRLKTEYLQYARPIEDVRRILDDSIGSRSLTELLHESREDRPA